MSWFGWGEEEKPSNEAAPEEQEQDSSEVCRLKTELEESENKYEDLSAEHDMLQKSLEMKTAQLAQALAKAAE